MNFQQIQFAAIAVAAIIVGYAIYKILQFFGVIGDEKTKGKEALMKDSAIQGNQTEFLPIAGAAFKAKYKRQSTPQDIKNLTPSSGVLTSWRKQLIDARGFFNDNESGVYNVFRNLKSKLQLYAFAQNFQTYVKKSLIDYLNEFMDESELNDLNNIIKSLPII